MLNFYSDNDAGAGAVAIDGLGRIVVAGGANRDFAVVRLLQDGALDATFGGDGKVTSGKALNGFASEVLLDAAGRILTVGSAGDDFALVRFNSDGSLDTTFGSGGATFTDFHGSDVGRAAQFDSAGRIVAGGHTYTSTGGVDFVVARYTTEGLLDAVFGVDGVVITDSASSADYGQDLIVGECDRIVMSGITHDYGLGKDFLAVVRYMSDGELDTGFGDGGKVTTAFDGVEGWAMP